MTDPIGRPIAFLLSAFLFFWAISVLLFPTSFIIGNIERFWFHKKEGDNQSESRSGRDTWYQYAAFYIAFGFWPDANKPVFASASAQVPEGEHDKLRGALEEMAQRALDDDLRVWGKTPVTPSGLPVNGSLFDIVPARHWAEWRVDYMDLIADNPEQVHTTKSFSARGGSWGALMVNRSQVEAVWPQGSKPRPPLKILVGIGPGYEDDMGTIHDVNAVILNENVPMLNGVVLYRTLLSNDPKQNKRTSLTEHAISLAQGQKHIVRIARYDENDAILEENRKIMLWAPSSFFNASTLLPVARYSLLLEAESAIDGIFCKEVRRLRVDTTGNRLRLEHLRNIASVGDA
jgi:hypothetical protein